MASAVAKSYHGLLLARVRCQSVASRSYIIVHLSLLMDLSEPAIKSVLAVSAHVSVYLAFVGVGRFKALGNITTISAIVGRVNLVLVPPPARVDHRVQRRRASSLFLDLVRIFDLETRLGAISRHATRKLF